MAKFLLCEIFHLRYIYFLQNPCKTTGYPSETQTHDRVSFFFPVDNIDQLISAKPYLQLKRCSPHLN